MNKSSLPINHDISVFAIFSVIMLQIMQIPCFAKEIAESIEDISAQVEVGDHLVVSLRKQESNGAKVVFEASNSTSHPISIKCNIPSLEEHLFLGMPRSSLLRVRNLEKQIVRPIQTSSGEFWKPSASSSFIPVDWKFVREFRLQPNESITLTIDPTEALRFASTTNVFGEDAQWDEVQIVLELVIEDENGRQITRLKSPWLRVQ